MLSDCFIKGVDVCRASTLNFRLRSKEPARHPSASKQVILLRNFTLERLYHSLLQRKEFGALQKSWPHLLLLGISAFSPHLCSDPWPVLCALASFRSVTNVLGTCVILNCQGPFERSFVMLEKRAYALWQQWPVVGSLHLKVFVLHAVVHCGWDVCLGAEKRLIPARNGVVANVYTWI